MNQRDIGPVDPPEETPEPEEWDFDPSWSETARNAVRSVLSVRPDIDGPEAIALDQAASLLNTAESLEAIARAADYRATGSTGQEVVHWAVPEARQARTTAAQIMSRLAPKSEESRSEAARRGEHPME